MPSRAHKKPAFEHPVFGDFDPDVPRTVNFDGPVEAMPDNWTHYEGYGAVAGFDRPGLVANHGEKSGGHGIIKVNKGD